MSVEIKVPVLPESVTDAVIGSWHKKPGEPVKRDENLVDIETDKVVLEVVAPSDGHIEEILHKAGDTVLATQMIARYKKMEFLDTKVQTTTTFQQQKEQPSLETDETEALVSPSVRRLLSEHNLLSNQITGTGKGSRVTKEDIQKYLNKQGAQKDSSGAIEKNEEDGVSEELSGNRVEKRLQMSRLRAKIAERLLASQHTTATLTTFNEINMKPVMDLREKYKKKFEKDYGTRLGFMSFFTTAVVEALKHFPLVNASIDADDIVYHGFFDIGIAVSSDRGLVVPIIRDADLLNMAEIEKQIRDFGTRAQQGKLSLEEITGGTFTISNGGVFGSLMSTPILNPPQSAILGMNAIKERVVVENGEMVIRPMMYVALSYDHRIIDGKESVQFLLKIKEILEEPVRLLIGI